MEENIENLKQSLTDILQDNLYLCSECLDKSTIMLRDVKSLNIVTAKKVNRAMKRFLNKMALNVNSFMTKLDACIEKYEQASRECDKSIPVEDLTSPQPKKKLNLSLRKINDDIIEEMDIELANSSMCNKESPKNNQSTNGLIKTEQGEGNNIKREIFKDTDDNEEFQNSSQNGGLSDDSETTIPINYFDAQELVELKQDDPCSLDLLAGSLADKCAEFIASIDVNRKTDDANQLSVDFDVKVKNGENGQIDSVEKIFTDRDPQLNKNKGMEQMSELDKWLEKMHQGEYEENRQHNVELLTMLTNKLENNPTYPDSITISLEADAALNEMDSISTETGSNFSELSGLDDDWSLDGGDVESGGSSSSSHSDCDNSATEDFLQSQCTDVTVELPKLDTLSEKEIDRLCNLNNINKRKCHTLLKLSRGRRKRQRLLSTSSSDTTDGGSVTPDLPLDDITEMNKTSNADNSAELLADQICNNLSNSETDSLENESDVENKSPNGKNEKTKKNEVKHMEVVLSDSEEITVKKSVSTWRNSSLLRSRLWSDTDEESSSDAESPNKKRTRKSKPPKLISNGNDLKYNGDTTVISDTDDDDMKSDDVESIEAISDEDSDVEFISQLGADDPSAKGRKNIRRIITDSELTAATQQAKLEEDERIKRLEQTSKNLEVIQSQRDEFVLDFDVENGRPLITVDYRLTNRLKLHQRSGVKFMWEVCYESVKMLEKNPGTGCILAHCMGLGKTFQVITLIHTLFTHSITNTKHVLILCPLSTVLNWENEFNITFDLLDQRPEINLFFLIKESKGDKCRIVEQWRKKTGVLVMGYETYRSLQEHVGDSLKKIVTVSLIDPGPDLVVCDEGHHLQNWKTKKHQALINMKTKRRIILTGTPLQNNLKEYYHMVELVKPHLLGTLGEYTNRFINPIMNGQFFDSSPEDINLMKKRTHVLAKLLRKTIDRVEGKILKEYLPEISDYTIYIKPHPIQVQFYQKYIDMARQFSDGFLYHFTVTKYITLHPYVLHQLDEARKEKQLQGVANGGRDTYSAKAGVPSDWFRDLYTDDMATNLYYGSKMSVIMLILHETIRNGEKILIFSSSLIELNCIEHFLKRHITTDSPTWISGLDYFRMDGSVKPELRNEICNKFNDENNTRLKVFLISQKVGGLGLNLIGANRVIIVGGNFNPSVDTQSIYRIYRFGQRKKCFVYRLIAMGTMEEKVYQKCVVKLAVSETVVDRMHIKRHYKSNDIQEMYNYNFDFPVDRPIPVVPSDKLLASIFQYSTDIYKYHEHDALLENRPEEELNDEEKKLAWDEFNIEEAKKNAPIVQPVLLSNTQQVAPYVPYLQRFPQLYNEMRNSTSMPQDPKAPKPMDHMAVIQAMKNTYNRQVYLHNTNPNQNINQGATTSGIQNQKIASFSGGFRVDPPKYSRSVFQRNSQTPNNPIAKVPEETANTTGEFNYTLNKFLQ